MTNLESASGMVKLYPYCEAFQHSKVIKDILFPKCLLVEIPEELRSNSIFFKISELNGDSKKLEGKISVPNKTWIEIDSNGLNLSIGQHIYELKFLVNELDVVNYYFIYNIQSDNPDKPYLYMEKYR